jgi:hypothetical protein
LQLKILYGRKFSWLSSLTVTTGVLTGDLYQV